MREGLKLVTHLVLNFVMLSSALHTRTYGTYDQLVARKEFTCFLLPPASSSCSFVPLKAASLGTRHRSMHFIQVAMIAVPPLRSEEASERAVVNERVLARVMLRGPEGKNSREARRKERSEQQRKGRGRQERSEPGVKVLRDLGEYQGRRMQVVQEGTRTFIVHGDVKAEIPPSWSFRADACSVEYLHHLLQRRVSSCSILLVSGLPSRTGEKEVERMFEGFELAAEEGTNIIILPEQEEGGRFACVRMRDGEEATRALELNGTEVQGSVVLVKKRLWGTSWEKMRRARTSGRTAAERLEELVAQVGAAPLSPNVKLLLERFEQAPMQVMEERAGAEGGGAAGEEETLQTGLEDVLLGERVRERTVCKLISEFGRRGQLERAFAVFLWTRGRGPNLFHFNAMMSASGKKPRLSLSLALLRCMREVRVEPDVFTFSSLVQACAKERRGKLAVSLLRQMEGEGIAPNAVLYNNVLVACARANLVGRAIQLFWRMKEEGLAPDLVSYSAIISAFASKKDLRSALLVLEEVRARHLKPDKLIYTSLLHAAQTSRRPKEAMRIFQLMQEDAVAPDAVVFSCLIGAWARVGDWRRATEVWDLCKKTLRREEVTMGVFNELMRAAAIAGRQELAMCVLSELQERGQELNPFMLRLLDASGLAGGQRSRTDEEAGEEGEEGGERAVDSCTGLEHRERFSV